MEPQDRQADRWIEPTYAIHVVTLDAFYSAVLGLWASITLRSAKLELFAFACILVAVLLAIFLIGIGRTTPFWKDKVIAYGTALGLSALYRYWFMVEVQPLLDVADRLSPAQLWFVSLVIILWIVTLEAETKLHGLTTRRADPNEGASGTPQPTTGGLSG